MMEADHLKLYPQPSTLNSNDLRLSGEIMEADQLERLLIQDHMLQQLFRHLVCVRARGGEKVECGRRGIFPRH